METRIELIHRVNRIAGQVRGIRRMIESGRTCIAVVTQIKAVLAALGALETRVVEERLSECLDKTQASAKTGKSPATYEQEIDVLLRKVRRR